MKKFSAALLLLAALFVLTACGAKVPGEPSPVALPNLAQLMDGESMTPEFILSDTYMTSLFSTLWLLDAGVSQEDLSPEASGEFYNCAVLSSLAYREADETFALAVVTGKTNRLLTWKAGAAEGTAAEGNFGSLDKAEKYLTENYSAPVRNSQDGVNFTISYLESIMTQNLE